MIKDRHGEIEVIKEKAEADYMNKIKASWKEKLEKLDELINEISDDALNHFVMNPHRDFRVTLKDRYPEKFKEIFGTKFGDDEREAIRKRLNRAGFRHAGFDTYTGFCNLSIHLYNDRDKKFTELEKWI